jgi:hypothetical protein
MAETIILEHEDDPLLRVELSKPSYAAYAEFWNDYVAAAQQNRDPIEAQRNLLIDCRVSPSEAEFSRILEDWPGLPAAAWPELLNLAGGVSWVGLKSGRKLPAEQLAELEQNLGTRVIDLPALAAEAAGYKLDGPSSAFETKWGEDLDALTKEGLTSQAVADIVASHRRPGSLFALRSRHGVFILRKPSSGPYMAYLTGSRRDAFKSAERLVSACAIHPKPGVLGPILEELPALATILAAELRTMAGEGAAVVKKGSPSSAKLPGTSSSEPRA